MLKPVVEEEMSMLGEITHLQTLTDDLKALTMDPHKLPPSSEQVILDLKGSESTWSYQTPPSSPSTTVSRKSSMCSSLNSAPARLSSVSSHDSGFISQDAFQSKSPSPMPPDGSQLSNGFDHHAALCSGQSGECLPLGPSGPGVYTSSRVPTWKDWAKPGPYEQSMVNTLKRSKDRKETTDPSSHHSADLTPGEVKGSPSGISAKEDREAHEELARALARGLQLDISGSSRDSLQGSSGYSSQTHTPCCSEDTIPSQVSDCDYYSVGVDQEGEHQDFDKSCTVPRNSDITQSYRRMFQSKRPASTAGLPCNPSSIITPGVATIRRTPSSKPNLRRPSGGLNLGPIPIKPPMIPVKTPTVPDHPGFPSRAASEEGNTPRTPLSPPTTPLSPGCSGPLSPRSGSWEAQHLSEGSDPPDPPPQPGGRMCEWERRPLPELLEETESSEVEDFLVAIRRGVRLKRTSTNDRSAPSIY
ncbi:Protein MTSS 1 [Dissostichus eleginoides]|uniref:Protein MTSS 1 n=1 Tax=Dissostichus eleginoides TaxID=100907 RepID=A0AAD9EVN3_DISEL|nr:Protein MTSS 1 [Dissostichus eleginoides]